MADNLYACTQFSGNTCTNWVLLDTNILGNQLAQLANLSLGDVTQLWVVTLMLFATAYVFKHLPFFIRRR